MEIRSERSKSGNENMEIAFPCSMRMRCCSRDTGHMLIKLAISTPFLSISRLCAVNDTMVQFFSLPVVQPFTLVFQSSSQSQLAQSGNFITCECKEHSQASLKDWNS